MIKNKNHRIARSSLLYMLVLLFAFAPLPGGSVYAQETQADMVLPVMQKFVLKNVQHEPDDQRGSYELTAQNPGNPMPEGSANGKYLFTMEGNGQTALSIKYAHGGQYRYVLRQITEDAKGYTYDRAVYSITVFVEKGDKGQLTPQIIVENEQNEKCEEILFENTYTGEEVPPAPEKPTDKPKPETPKPTEPKPTESKPGKPKPTENTGEVKTGDSAPVTAWCVMLSLALVSFSAVLVLKRQKER